jgi:hypothetical protein
MKILHAHDASSRLVEPERIRSPEGGKLICRASIPQTLPAIWQQLSERTTRLRKRADARHTENGTPRNSEEPRTVKIIENETLTT